MLSPLPYNARGQSWPGALPWWWRISAWTVMSAYTAFQAPVLWRQIAAGAAMAIGSLAIQLAGSERQAVRTTAVCVATASGYAAMALSPNGIGEALVVIAAARTAVAFHGRTQIAAIAVNTVAFAGGVWWVSHSASGVLAGLAIPALVQRAADQRALVAERDRAQALLVEVQAGRDAEAQAAALRERGRIARDLHDVLAHSLAGLSVQLQAVRALAAREGVGPTVLAPLDTAAALAQEGLAEARQAVASLRDPVGLGLAEVAALVQRHPGEAHLQVSGTPGEVSAECGHAIYRAVQESLTNAARYAPGSPVQVGVDWTAERLQVRVDDAGRPRGRSPIAGTSTGLGLAGMDERVRQAGGTLQAGPRPDGGWRVEITVPLRAEVAAS